MRLPMLSVGLWLHAACPQGRRGGVIFLPACSFSLAPELAQRCHVLSQKHCHPKCDKGKVIMRRSSVCPCSKGYFRFIVILGFIFIVSSLAIGTFLPLWEARSLYFRVRAAPPSVHAWQHQSCGGTTAAESRLPCGCPRMRAGVHRQDLRRVVRLQLPRRLHVSAACPCLLP